MITHKPWSAVALACVPLLSCGENSIKHQEEHAVGSAISDSQSLLAPLGYTDSEDIQLATSTPTSQQWYRVDSGRTFTLVDYERIQHQGSESWVMGQQSFPTRLGVTSVGYGPTDNLVVSGTNDQGDGVVHHWEFVPASGSITVSPNLPGAQHNLVPKRINRTPLLTLPTDHYVQHAVLDWEQRYVAVLIRTQTQASLQILHLAPDKSVVAQVEAANSTSHPGLEALEYLQQYDHATLGRVLYGYHVGPGIAVVDVSNETLTVTEAAMVYVDADNDGTFDNSPVVDTPDALEAAGLLTLSDYQPLYVSYN